MTSAFGKVIVLGEHAVVYGHPAIAGAIDRRVRCRVEASDSDRSRLVAACWGLDVRAGDGMAGAALSALVDGVGVRGSVLVRAESDLPVAAGLGSSAALSVACARALCEHAGIERDVEALANEAERAFHENPSGVDVALAARGGIGVYIKGRGLEPLDVEPISIVVGLTGAQRNTAAMVRRVRERVEADPDGGRAALEGLADAAIAGRDALVAGDLEALGRAMDRAQGLLLGFGLSTDAIEAMVAAAKQRGALGAKLTGAGGGGAVIALCPGREDEIEAAWRADGFEAFATRVGVR